MSIALDIIGWLGSAMLMVCAIPEAILAVRRKHTHMPWNMIILLGGGEFFMFIYVLPKLDWPLIANYGVNIISMSVILYYKTRKHPHNRG